MSCSSDGQSILVMLKMVFFIYLVPCFDQVGSNKSVFILLLGNFWMV
ncbi:hypothetical protein NM1482_2088 [Neisseria meningitidis NM1482]|nr:hypothetical protein NM69100_2193 [Neisseria meningitidis 69100]EOC03291.1 hypothetical protein NM1482_2088 [Neisseria meningitidis NM1482]